MSSVRSGIGRPASVAILAKSYRHRKQWSTFWSLATATTADSPKAATAKNYAPWSAHDPDAMDTSPFGDGGSSNEAEGPPGPNGINAPKWSFDTTT